MGGREGGADVRILMHAKGKIVEGSVSSEVGVGVEEVVFRKLGKHQTFCTAPGNDSCFFFGSQAK